MYPIIINKKIIVLYIGLLSIFASEALSSSPRISPDSNRTQNQCLIDVLDGKPLDYYIKQIQIYQNDVEARIADFEEIRDELDDYGILIAREDLTPSELARKARERHKKLHFLQASARRALSQVGSMGGKLAFYGQCLGYANPRKANLCRKMYPSITLGQITNISSPYYDVDLSAKILLPKELRILQIPSPPDTATTDFRDEYYSKAVVGTTMTETMYADFMQDTEYGNKSFEFIQCLEKTQDEVEVMYEEYQEGESKFTEHLEPRHGFVIKYKSGQPVRVIDRSVQ